MFQYLLIVFWPLFCDEHPAEPESGPHKHGVDCEVDEESEASRAGAEHCAGQRQHPHLYRAVQVQVSSRVPTPAISPARKMMAMMTPRPWPPDPDMAAAATTLLASLGMRRVKQLLGK